MSEKQKHDRFFRLCHPRPWNPDTVKNGLPGAAEALPLSGPGKVIKVSL